MLFHTFFPYLGLFILYALKFILPVVFLDFYIFIYRFIISGRHVASENGVLSSECEASEEEGGGGKMFSCEH